MRKEEAANGGLFLFYVGFGLGFVHVSLDLPLRIELACCSGAWYAAYNDFVQQALHAEGHHFATVERSPDLQLGLR